MPPCGILGIHQPSPVVLPHTLASRPRPTPWLQVSQAPAPSLYLRQQEVQLWQGQEQQEAASTDGSPRATQQHLPSAPSRTRAFHRIRAIGRLTRPLPPKVSSSKTHFKSPMCVNPP